MVGCWSHELAVQREGNQLVPAGRATSSRLVILGHWYN